MYLSSHPPIRAAVRFTAAASGTVLLGGKEFPTWNRQRARGVRGRRSTDIRSASKSRILAYPDLEETCFVKAFKRPFYKNKSNCNQTHC